MTLHRDSFPGPKAFARYMLRDNRLLQQVDMTRIRQAWNIAIEIILFRESCWQVELIVIFPNAVVGEHRHLRADSCELALGGGNAEAFIGSMIVKQHTRGQLAANLVRVPPNVWHGGKAGPEGAVWLSFQHWREGEPGWTQDDWESRASH